LGALKWAINQLIEQGIQLHATGERKRLIPLSEVEALLGHRVTVREFFASVVWRRQAREVAPS
jgi:hypothetical protein